MIYLLYNSQIIYKSYNLIYSLFILFIKILFFFIFFILNENKMKNNIKPNQLLNYFYDNLPKLNLMN